MSLNSLRSDSRDGSSTKSIPSTSTAWHAFSVAGSAGTTEYNNVNPIRRDTVSVGLAGDNVTIRFVTDNPGPWFLHCRIDFHLVAGPAIVFAEDAPDVAHVNPVLEAWKELCPKYDTTLNHEQMGEL